MFVLIKREFQEGEMIGVPTIIHTSPDYADTKRVMNKAITDCSGIILNTEDCDNISVRSDSDAKQINFSVVELPEVAVVKLKKKQKYNAEDKLLYVVVTSDYSLDGGVLSHLLCCTSDLQEAELRKLKFIVDTIDDYAMIPDNIIKMLDVGVDSVYKYKKVMDALADETDLLVGPTSVSSGDTDFGDDWSIGADIITLPQSMIAKSLNLKQGKYVQFTNGSPVDVNDAEACAGLICTMVDSYTAEYAADEEYLHDNNGYLDTANIYEAMNEVSISGFDMNTSAKIYSDVLNTFSDSELCAVKTSEVESVARLTFKLKKKF